MSNKRDDYSAVNVTVIVLAVVVAAFILSGCKALTGFGEDLADWSRRNDGWNQQENYRE